MPDYKIQLVLWKNLYDWCKPYIKEFNNAYNHYKLVISQSGLEPLYRDLIIPLAKDFVAFAFSIAEPIIVPKSPPKTINQPILTSRVFLNQWVKAPEEDEAKILFASFATA